MSLPPTVTPRRSRGLNARLVMVGVALALAWLGVGYRLVVVQGTRAEEYAARGRDQRLHTETLAADRGTIFDAEGRELALTVDSVTVYANPAEVTDPAVEARYLASLTGQDPDEVEAILSGEGTFAYVARQLDPADADLVRAAELPGIYFLEEPKRVYPAGPLTAQVIGLVQPDTNEGLEGLELFYETALAGTPGQLRVERDPAGRTIPQGDYSVTPAEPGSDLVLTLRTSIQYAATQALAEAMARTGATSGSVVVLDPVTGGVLAMANLPGFDPEDRASLLPENVRNRAVTDLFEPGSTQKLVTIAAALEAGLVEPGTVLEIPASIEILDTVFQDFTQHDSLLTVTEIVAHSSNLGTILLGEMLGAQRLHDYMVAFGQGRRSRIDFPGEAAGVLQPSEDWCITTCVAGTSIGYHVSVTALQMAAAYATVANDGLWVQPHFVAEVVDGQGSRVPTEPNRQQVVSVETARQMRAMLAAVVEQGTGSLAAVGGYRVGGKTGTTKKYLSESGEYSDEDVVASFIGMAPIDNPRVVVAVVLDSPQEDASGGTGAAPVFSAVALAALHQMGVPPDAP
ncbi:MAG: Peptidoglycan glycosyltransferase [Actinobacteria bacterium]|nr:Peptidoglycan glycosyltransferase [Actinomycetota bacterium]